MIQLRLGRLAPVVVLALGLAVPACGDGAAQGCPGRGLAAAVPSVSFPTEGNPQVVVRFRPGTAPSEAQRVLAALGAWEGPNPSYGTGWSATSGIYVFADVCLRSEDRVELRRLLDRADSDQIESILGL